MRRVRNIFRSRPVKTRLAYITLQLVHFPLYFHASTGSRQSRRTLGIFVIALAVSWVPLILGALFGGTAQTVGWAVVFAIEFGGGHLASKLSGWQLCSPPTSASGTAWY